MPRLSAAASLAALLLFAAGAAALQISPAVRAELAPTGTLRAAINYGNPILAERDPLTGGPRGVSVDISQELARRLGVAVQLVTYEGAGRVVEAVASGAWDVAYVGIDPERGGAGITYTAPYVMIEGAYLVREESPIRRNEDVDREGVRVVVGNGSAYDLFLSRALKLATLVRSPTSPGVTDMFVAQRLDVAAGVRQQLEADAGRIPGLRMLDGRFMVINQGMAIPSGRDAGAAYLRTFIEELKASGFVAQALARHGIQGASVAPPAAAAAVPGAR